MAIYVLLLIYIFDLVAWRDAHILGIWIGFGVVTLAFIYVEYVQEHAYLAHHWLTGLVKATCQILLLFCTTCWALLQVQWLPLELPEYAAFLENSLHTIASPVSAVVMSHSFLHHFVWMEYTHDNHDPTSSDEEVDVVLVLTTHAPLWVWKACPFVFCSWFAWSLMHVAPSFSSFRKEHVEDDHDKKVDSRFASMRELEPEYEYEFQPRDVQGIAGKKRSSSSKRATLILSREHGQALSFAFLSFPVLLYIGMVLKGCITDFSGMDLILTVTIPFLIHQMLVHYKYIWWTRDLFQNSIILTRGMTMAQLHFKLQVVSAALTLISIQCRYLYPISVSLKLAINGGSDPSFALAPWKIHLCLCSGLVGMILSLWQLLISSKDDWEQEESVLSKHYEEFLLVALIGSGFFFGIAMGIPWNDILALLTAIISLVSFFITQRVSKGILVTLERCITTFASSHISLGSILVLLSGSSVFSFYF